MDKLLLERIVGTLNTGAWNYAASLAAIEVPLMESKEAMLALAFGENVILGGINQSDCEQVWDEIRNGLFFRESDNVGPTKSAIGSEEFATLLEALKRQIEELAASSVSIDSFWLREGHPFYPVYWDFAFLFTGQAKATILIGSASD